ncbi:MAG: hypothetical protein KIT84_28070 [Labilithrix sp.]|nr:hypothetical protein [Labilithrix sp.]MCW5814915.1 hypothetical protein [Labilithrix sp.]
MRTHSSFRALFIVLVLAAAGCDKDKPKPEETKKSEPTPVPSDLVFNDFIPSTGAPLGVRARDAGIEGGLAEVAGGAEPGDPNAGGAPDNLKVTDPGADPKAARKYTFVQGRVEKRLLTISQSTSGSMGGQTAPPQEVTFKLHLDLTPKQVKKEGTAMELKLTKVEIPGAPPQLAPLLAGLNNLAGVFDVSPQGEAGEVQFGAPPQVRSQDEARLFQSVLQGLSQAAQLLVAPLPEAPIGTGAKWELPGSTRPGEPDLGTKKFAAKELAADGGVIEAEIEVKVPRRAQQTKGGTVFIEVDGKGKYTYQTKFNAPASKVEGELTINQKVEVPAQGGQPKQLITETQTSKHTVELAK